MAWQHNKGVFMKKGNKFLEITLCLMMMLLLVGCENKKVITKYKNDVVIKNVNIIDALIDVFFITNWFLRKSTT